MSKADRIPDAWPAQMSDAVAAAYMDMSTSQFLILVKAKRLPDGKKVFGTVMVRWLRADLDACVLAEHRGKFDKRPRRGEQSAANSNDIDREFGLG